MEYFETEMSEAEKSLLEDPDDFSAYDIARKFTRELGPLKEVECPSVYKLARTPKKLGDLVQVENGLLLVTDTLRATIESLEPSVHQFWLVMFHLPRQKTWPTKYFGMRIGQFLDGFRPEASEPGSFKESRGRFSSYETRDDSKGLAFDKETISGKTLWRERKLTRPNVMMSDALQAAVRESGMLLPTHYQAREV